MGVRTIQVGKYSLRSPETLTAPGAVRQAPFPHSSPVWIARVRLEGWGHLPASRPLDSTAG